MSMLDVLVCVLVIAIAGTVFSAATRGYGRAEVRVFYLSFAAHVLGGFAYQYVVYNVFGFGDAMVYFSSALRITELLRADFLEAGPQVMQVFLQQESSLPIELRGKDSTGSMAALTGAISYLVLDSRWAVHLTFAMLSVHAKLGLYSLVRESFSRQDRSYVAAAMMLTPSFIYWTSGIIKESATVLGMGLAAFGAQRVARRRASGIPPLLLGLLIASLIKPHVLMAGALGLAAWFYWQRAVARGTVDVRPVTLLAATAGGLAVLLVLGEVFPRFALNAVLEEAAYLQSQGHRGGSAYSLGAAGGGPVAQATIAPLALLTAWFRPTLLEATNLLQAISALENTIWLFLFLRAATRLGYKGLFLRLKFHPILAFAIVFAIVLGTGTGLGTANLGTLSRYRAPMMPFFVLVLVALNLPERKKVPAAAKPPPRPKRQRPPPFRARTPAPPARPAPSPAPYGSRTPRATP